MKKLLALTLLMGCATVRPKQELDMRGYELAASHVEQMQKRYELPREGEPNAMPPLRSRYYPGIIQAGYMPQPQHHLLAQAITPAVQGQNATFQNGTFSNGVTLTGGALGIRHNSTGNVASIGTSGSQYFGINTTTGVVSVDNGATLDITGGALRVAAQIKIQFDGSAGNTFIRKNVSNNLEIDPGAGNNVEFPRAPYVVVANAADGLIFQNEAEIQWPDTKIAEVGTQLVATAAGGFKSSAGVYSNGDAFQCSGGVATCQISTLTPDSVTSASVPAYEFALGADLTTGDLGWAFRDSASVYVVKIDEQGSISSRMGTSTGYASMVGVANVNTTGVGNVGASGPDDLQTYTLPANALVTTGRCIQVYAAGTTGATTNAKTVRLTIGPTPTAIITKQLQQAAATASTWEIKATICRTGASTQDFYAEAYNNGAAAVGITDGPTILKLGAFGTLTQTETNALDIKVQSTVSTSNDDIRCELLVVNYL